MTLPRFTADVSFYRSSFRHQLSVMFAGPRQGGRVTPSVSRFSSSCAQSSGVLLCATCLGDLGCYVCAGPLGGSFMCFWEGGTN
jgi:hypothetical protein